MEGTPAAGPAIPPADPTLTIVVPTRNRSPFLVRLLAYYRSCRLPYRLVLADGSEPAHVARTRAAVAAAQEELAVEHRVHDPGAGLAERLRAALEGVDTPYAAVAADDDFFVPGTLALAARFLAAHPDYSVAHGPSFWVTVDGGGAHGAITDVRPVPQATTEGASAAERVLAQFVPFLPTWYSVHRSGDLRANLRWCCELGLGLTFGELLCSAASAVRGKAKHLDRLFLIRQSGAPKEYPPLDVFAWMAQPAWLREYGAFVDRMGAELARADGLPEDGARARVVHAFWSYWCRYLAGDVFRPEIVDGKAWMKRGLRRIPGLRRAWQLVLEAMDRKLERAGVTLDALAGAASPYRADFRPIYEAIVSPAAPDRSRPRSESRT